MVVSPSFELPSRATPPISQTRARRHTGKLGEPPLRGSRGFLLTLEATAYGRGQKAARRVDQTLKERDHRLHPKNGAMKQLQTRRPRGRARGERIRQASGAARPH